LSVKAVVFRDEAGGPALEEVELSPPGSGEVEVRITAAGICGSDLHVLHGRSNAAVLPAVLGHEGAGVVESVGPGVSAVQVGDRVVVTMAPGEASHVTSDGEELHPFVGSGTLSERVVVAEAHAFPVPDGIPLDVAALCSCGVLTGIGAVMNIARIEPGAHVVVVGCGGVGLSVVQGCRIAGATRIIAVDTNPAKKEIARRLGADVFIALSGRSLVEAVREVAPDGLDVAFEVVGLPEMVGDALECTRPGGTCVAVAAYPPGSSITVGSATLFMNRRLLGCAGGGGEPTRDLPRIFDLYLSGRLDLDSMVGDRYPLDRALEAFIAAEQGAPTRVIVVP
jgi:S-(hydroxymethyl)glutathione dehydrogenase/alcohol dehydrogenase